MYYIYTILISALFSSLLSHNVDKRLVLPENMPLHTKVLWGEKGLFRRTNIAPLTRQDELILRVKMLQLHQKIAMGSLAAFYYQSYLGNQLINGNYDNYEKHSSMSKVVWSTYMLSASLSYFAPPGMRYTKKMSSMKIHRALSWIHFAGMTAIPWLGYNISKSSMVDRDSAVQLHQNVAYGTLITMSLSALLSFLPY